MDTSLHEPFLEQIGVMYAEVKAVLDERQRRLVLGAAARRLGRGGIKKVAAAAGVDPETVSRGVKEVAAGPVADGRVRVAGAGSPLVTDALPGVGEALKRWWGRSPAVILSRRCGGRTSRRRSWPTS